MSGLYRIPPSPKSKVFVSYHHHGDAAYYDLFARHFEGYNVVQDTSVDREIDSDNVDYVIQTIRDDYLTGSSCTIVLCGNQTPWRKFVDWEIKATLDKQHALIGVVLPTNPQGANGTYIVPDRLFDNIESGYARWDYWTALTPARLAALIWQARGADKALIRNSRELRRRNGARP